MGEATQPSVIEKLMLIMQTVMLLGTVVMIVWVGWRYAKNSGGQHGRKRDCDPDKDRGNH